MTQAMTKTEWPAATRVAYLGPEGTYSSAAVCKYFGTGIQAVPCTAIVDVFAAVREGLADFGVVPVENSSEGSVVMTLDCFATTELDIYAEILLRIRHCLMSSRETASSGIQRIVSHQQSLGQCRDWLQAHYADVERSAVSSNAEAAKLAASTLGTAAIAGHRAAQLYGLELLAEGIEDSQDNSTRFLVVSRDLKPPRSGQDKSSLIISTANEPGTLFRTLEPFNRFGVNLTKLESRPSRKEAWSYAFYIDLSGHVDDADVQSVLSELYQSALEVKVLGSYPVADADE